MLVAAVSLFAGLNRLRLSRSWLPRVIEGHRLHGPVNSCAILLLLLVLHGVVGQKAVVIQDLRIWES